MCRPRFRLRTLMVAVAVVGLGIAAERLRERSRRFAEFARNNASQAASCDRTGREAEAMAAALLAGLIKPPPRVLDALKRDLKTGDDSVAAARWAGMQRQGAARMARYVAYYSALQRKYERAARHPWLPVPPDPPRPN